MKKVLFLVLLLAGVAGAALYYVQQAVAPLAGSDYYADYLPTDALATVTLLDMQGLAKVFPESALAKFFAKPTMRAILTEQQATEETLHQYDELYDSASQLLDNPVVQQLFGDDLTLALLAPDPARLKTHPAEEQKKILLAFGSSAAAESAQSLARLTLRDSFSKETINGLELTRIQLDNNEVLYSSAKDGVILLAFNPETIAIALKQKATGHSLRNTPAFVAAKKFWAEASQDHCFVQFYANPEKVSSLVAAVGKPELKKAAAYLQGFKSISSVTIVHQGDVQVKSRVDYDLAKLPESVRQQYQPLPEKNNLSLHLLTDKTLLYSWFSGLNDQLFAAVEPAQYQAMDAAVQQQLGLSLQGLFAALGPQVGMTVSEVVSTGLFPLPKLVLFAQVQQRETAVKLVETLRQKMAEQNMAKERVIEVNGHPIYYWSLLPSDVAHPALALTDKMLYLANGEAALKTLLAEEGKGLSQAMRELLGPKLTAQFSAANASAFTLRPALLSTEAQKMTSWAAAAFSASARVSAERLREEIFRLLQSLDFVIGSAQAQEDHANSVLVFRRKAV
ncbi:DUF3352 domain-containing protein [Candidatus Electronema sp. PJ]|uniref:DUF3352 domain-containing protein n=1 Tax=Candidatus Electronema sp. PJ TaxID=3401572 RepID=UPI003AA9B7B6